MVAAMAGGCESGNDWLPGCSFNSTALLMLFQLIAFAMMLAVTPVVWGASSTMKILFLLLFLLKFAVALFLAVVVMQFSALIFDVLSTQGLLFLRQVLRLGLLPPRSKDKVGDKRDVGDTHGSY